MAERCRDCGAELFGDETARGLCAGCEAAMGVQTNPTLGPASEKEERVVVQPLADDEDPPAWMLLHPLSQGGPEWAIFRHGLAVLTLCAVGSLIFVLVLILPFFLTSMEEWPTLFGRAQWLLATGPLSLTILQQVGLALLCGIPADTGLRGRAVTANACTLSMAFLFGIVVSLSWGRPVERENGALCASCVFLLLCPVALYCIVSVLSGAARKLSRPDLGTAITVYFVIFIVLTFLAVVFWNSLGRALQEQSERGNRDTVRLLRYTMLSVPLAIDLIFVPWFVALMLHLRRAAMGRFERPANWPN